MQKTTTRVIHFLLIICLGILGACTKKEADPEPFTPSLYFKGSFGDDKLNYNYNNGGFKWRNDPTFFSGGFLGHVNADDTYFFHTNYISWWYSNDISSKEFLTFNIENIKLNVNKDYVFSAHEYFDYLQSTPIKPTRNYSYGENATAITIKKGVSITYIDKDGIVWNTLDYNSSDGNGYLHIQNKQNIGTRPQLLVTGTIECKLQQESNSTLR